MSIPEDAVAIPVLELTAPWLATGAELIAGRRAGPVDAAVLLTKNPPELIDDEYDDAAFTSDATPVDQVEWFRASATPNARHLAEFLAAAPLTLPVMRLVQQLMLPGSMPHDLAEVFLSSLLYRVTPEEPAVDAEQVLYDFTKGVRQVLLSGLRTGEALTILDEISQYVNRRMGTSFDFPAFLAGQHTAGPWTQYGQPFAAVARDVLTALGGRYAMLAEQLDTGSDAHEAGLSTVPRQRAVREREAT